MSILIKGIEKPKDCGICPFKRDGWPDEWEMHCKLLGRQVGYFDKKNKVPKDCPLVEIPTPHGRLIDADALIKHMKRDPLFPLVDRYGVTNVIQAAPTIIEAEEDSHE